jgi:hypothetical protein
MAAMTPTAFEKRSVSFMKIKKVCSFMNSSINLLIYDAITLFLMHIYTYTIIVRSRQVVFFPQPKNIFHSWSRNFSNPAKLFENFETCVDIGLELGSLR